VRPSAIVYGKSANQDWDALDRALIEAYQILEDERCPECGQPTWICRNDDPNIQFEIKKDVCYAKRALEEKNADLKDIKNAKDRAKAKASWGAIEYPTPFTLDESPLPTRKEYYDRVAKTDT
jgi:hypothetical protein